MGFKAIKDIFKIGHIVHVREDIIYIGSAYVSELAHINMNTGEIVDKDNFLYRNYIHLLQTPPDKILAIIQEKDDFDQSIPVYRAEGDKIVTHYCEKVGWPNTTHEGILIYENEFFINEKDAFEYQKKDIATYINFLKEEVVGFEEKKQEANTEILIQELMLASLLAKYKDLK